MSTKILLPYAALLAAVSALAQQPSRLSPVRIILVGDSTVADKNGWGPGFCADVVQEVACVNMAKNGRSTSSYREEGSWANVMKELKSNSSYSATYVLIQFGHNDQPGKPGRSTGLATEFPANLRRYTQEVKSTGAIPVLITSLTRRSFQDGKLKNDLVPWSDAAKKVAAEESVAVIDLNTESAVAVQKMGPVEANTMATAPPPPEILASAASGNSLPAPKVQPAAAAPEHPTETAVTPKADAAPVFDYTHLGAKGAAFFGRMVATDLAKEVPPLAPYIKP